MLLQDTGCTRHMKPRNIDFVSTYFYQNLELLHTSGAALNTVTATGGYDELLRYWKHMRREDMDTGTCFIPVFQPGHWCLVIAYMGERTTNGKVHGFRPGCPVWGIQAS